MDFGKIFASRAIPSICTAHPDVLGHLMRTAENRQLLIESTCNQVNQFGGYTGMTPVNFKSFIERLAVQSDFDTSNLILGGDHLGPNPWRKENADSAMRKAQDLVHSYVEAGYKKIHLDCSMSLGDDPKKGLDVELIASRASLLALEAEKQMDQNAHGVDSEKLVYVIGTEVPAPGGATAGEEIIKVSNVADVQQTIDAHKQAFFDLGLEEAWERVIAVVVQPGVDFGDDFVLDYDPKQTKALVSFIKQQPLVFEAHSTDYQKLSSLQNLVRDGFSILKVGPALTYAYREAIFFLAFMENELFVQNDRSDVIKILDEVMLSDPNYWEEYYTGTNEEQAFKRKFSLSDRIRYYWASPKVQHAVARLISNLSSIDLPSTLVSQFSLKEKSYLEEQGKSFTPENLISSRISFVLNDYWAACKSE